MNCMEMAQHLSLRNWEEYGFSRAIRRTRMAGFSPWSLAALRG